MLSSRESHSQKVSMIKRCNECYYNDARSGDRYPDKRGKGNRWKKVRARGEKTVSDRSKRHLGHLDLLLLDLLFAKLDVLEMAGVATDLAGLGGEGGSRAPLGRGTRVALGEHLVDLLERETLGLGDEEVGVDAGGRAKTAPHEEDVRLEVSLVLADHVRGDDGDDRVPQPVGCGGEGDTTRTDGKSCEAEAGKSVNQFPRSASDRARDSRKISPMRIQAAKTGEDQISQLQQRRRDGHGRRVRTTGTPSRGEEEDVDRDEGDLGVDGGNVVRDGVARSVHVSVVEADGVTDDGNKELADEHAEGTPDEQGATTEALDSPERDRGGADVDDLRKAKASVSSPRPILHPGMDARTVKAMEVRKTFLTAPVDWRNGVE